MNGYHEQVDVAKSTKRALCYGKMLRWFAAVYGAQQPVCGIVWLTGLRHAKRTVADQTGRIENPAG